MSGLTATTTVSFVGNYSSYQTSPITDVHNIAPVNQRTQGTANSIRIPQQSTTEERISNQPSRVRTLKSILLEACKSPLYEHIDKFWRTSHDTLPFEKEGMMTREIMPTKPVLLPRSHF